MSRITAAEPVGEQVAMLLEEFDRLSAACRQAILARLSIAPEHAVLGDHFARGKMLRARLVFAATAAVAAPPTQAANAAEAIELLHGASLIHDDIVDKANLRRGLRAVHLRVPHGAAIILGDYLVAHAVGVISKAVGVDPTNVVRAVASLTEHIEICCSAQVEELAPASDVLSEQGYLELVRRKTASQFAAAAQLGPILVGAPDPYVEALGRFATGIGMAFQIADDLLDLVGNENTLGKPIGNSLARGRPSLPVIYLFQYGTPALKSQYKKLIDAASPRASVARFLSDEGMLDLARRTQKRCYLQAEEALEALPASTGRQALAFLGGAIAGWTGWRDEQSL